MSKEKLKGRCSICENLDEVQEEFTRSRLLTGYRMLPAPEVPMVSYRYKCKVTNESLRRDEVETERECEHFKEKEEVLGSLCPQCGALNSIENRFCGNCGQSLHSYV